MWWPFFTIVGTRCLPARSLWPLCFRNRTGQKTRNRTTGPSVYYGPPKKADNIVGERIPSVLDSTRIKTEIPGPKSRALMERKRRAVSRGWANAISVFVEEARGALVTDVDGNVFIDFAGGIGAMNVGHADPRIAEAVKKQVEKFTHTAFQAAPYESFIELAERLNALVPGGFEKKTILANSGSEAVENAVKISRAHSGRPAGLAFGNGLHGRTLLAMTLTSKAGPFKEGFGPFAPEIYRVPAPYPYRCPAGEDCSGGCRGDCFGFVERVLVDEVEAENLAAIIVEPVSGEGGFIPFPDFYLRRLRELCDEHGILLIADEIQTGFGRTGRMFAIEHSGGARDLGDARDAGETPRPDRRRAGPGADGRHGDGQGPREPRPGQGACGESGGERPAKGPDAPDA